MIQSLVTLDCRTTGLITSKNELNETKSSKIISPLLPVVLPSEVENSIEGDLIELYEGAEI
jgi:hypothetical protein